MKPEESFGVVSIQVGKPESTLFGDREVFTAIHKHPLSGPAFLSHNQLEGDAQADLKHHGGKDKALCVYPHDHYDEWEKRLARSLKPGAFGENLTVSGLTEDQVHIGDVFHWGESIVQVCQPRQPCYKLANKLGMPEIIQTIQQSGWSGYYLRVLKEGWIAKTDRMIRTKVDPGRITVSFVNKVRWIDKKDARALHKVLRVEALASAWRNPLEFQLDKIALDQQAETAENG